MFHAERLLGSLLNAALSRGLKVAYERKGPRRPGIMGLAGDLLSENKAVIGLGLLGVAIATYEHFSQKTQGSAGSRMKRVMRGCRDFEELENQTSQEWLREQAPARSEHRLGLAGGSGLLRTFLSACGMTWTLTMES